MSNVELTNCLGGCGEQVAKGKYYDLCRNCYKKRFNKKITNKKDATNYNAYSRTCPYCGGLTKTGYISNYYRKIPVEYCYRCERYIHR